MPRRFRTGVPFLGFQALISINWTQRRVVNKFTHSSARQHEQNKVDLQSISGNNSTCNTLSETVLGCTYLSVVWQAVYPSAQQRKLCVKLALCCTRFNFAVKGKKSFLCCFLPLYSQTPCSAQSFPTKLFGFAERQRADCLPVMHRAWRHAHPGGDTIVCPKYNEEQPYN